MFATVPFPRLPEWLTLEPEERPVSLRPFGTEMGDLDLEFAGVERAWLVTRVLARCAQTASGRPAAEEAIWALPVSSRIEAMVTLAADTARPLEWLVRCAHADCGAESELTLSAAEVQQVAAQAGMLNPAPVEIADRTMWLRCPTGNDQRRWLAAGPVDAAAMAANLLVEPGYEELTEAGVSQQEISAALDTAMEHYDPLVGFHLQVGCAQCGRLTSQAPDLAGSALERLWRAQIGLIEEVHRLASHYHWTEEEIGKVPWWRRRAYLECIEGGEA